MSIAVIDNNIFDTVWLQTTGTGSYCKYAHTIYLQ